MRDKLKAYGFLALAVDLCSGNTSEDIKTYGLNHVRCRSRSKGR